MKQEPTVQSMVEVEVPKEKDWHEMTREINQKANQEDKLAQGLEPGVSQIIFFRLPPNYSKKDKAKE